MSPISAHNIGSGSVLSNLVLFFFYVSFYPTCAGNPDVGGSGDEGWIQQGDGVDMAQQSLLNKLIRHSLVLNRNQVEVLQRDPNSPLYSVKSFEELRL